MHYTLRVEYPFPPVGIVGAADGKNRRAFLCLGFALFVASVVVARPGRSRVCYRLRQLRPKD